jgi:hypothetical protein
LEISGTNCSGSGFEAASTKKNSGSKNRCRFWLFQKNLTELPGFTKTGKEEPGRFLGGYFTFTIWVGIKRIKTQSQRITSSGYLKKNSGSKNHCRFWLFQKNLTELPGFTKTGKEEPGRFLGGYFTFTIWDLGFKTSTDGQTGSGFQDLDTQTMQLILAMDEPELRVNI